MCHLCAGISHRQFKVSDEGPFLLSEFCPKFGHRLSPPVSLRTISHQDKSTPTLILLVGPLRVLWHCTPVIEPCPHVSGNLG